MTTTLEQRPLFILSSGRTGSTHLARMLQRHPEITCVSDLFEPVGEVPYFDSKCTVSGSELFEILSAPSFPQRIRSWRRRPNSELLFLHPDDEMVSLLLSYTLPFVSSDPMKLFGELQSACEEKEADTLPNSLIWFFEWLRDSCGTRYWVERTGGSLPHARSMIGLWPEAKYVHSFRDCRETTISMMTGSFFRLYLELEKNPRFGEWDEGYFPPIEEMGAMLQRWILEAEDALDELPEDQKHYLAFEDLIDRGEASLLELVGFLLDREQPSEVDRLWASEQAATLIRQRRRFPELDREKRRRLEASVAEASSRLAGRYRRELP